VTLVHGNFRDIGQLAHAQGARRALEWACRIAPHGTGLGVFRETRRAGLPEFEIKPGERALWDNRFSVELAKSESAPAIVRALGPTALEGQSLAPWLQALPRFARIALPVCARGGVLILPSLSAARGAASAFRANFVGGRGVSTTPFARQRKHARL